MVRLDMAVDVARYPRLKTRFNPPGRRGYLFLASSDDPRKGADVFRDLTARLGDFPRGWIGSGPEISGVPRISLPRALTPDFMRGISDRFDFFVSPALADPNPTTILESMAWGLPVICTPESGYYETSYRRSIRLDDLSGSAEVLRRLQFASETELLRMADEARSVVETEYTWHRFTSTVLSGLGL
jgi:glycosyltransferase involved in cell wall biosynthesis